MNKENIESEEDLDDDELKQQIELKCWEAFKLIDLDGSGYIDSERVKLVFAEMQLQTSEAEQMLIVSDIDPENTGKIPFSELKVRIVNSEFNRLKGSDETELLDAYVAMGGDEDGGGCVDAGQLIGMIKDRF